MNNAPELLTEPNTDHRQRLAPQEQARAPSALSPSVPALRILIVTESFLPQVNGVTNSVCRAAAFLGAHGHTVRIVAPTKPDAYADAEITTVAGVRLPAYRQFRLGIPAPRNLQRIAEEFAPDLVHVASPFGYGGAALRALRHLPTVAVYQTDIAGYAERYGLTGLASWCRARTARIHRSADLTLVPSQQNRSEFQRAGIPAVEVWGRGVDLEQFDPIRRSETLHRRLRGNARLLVGYVGRLSREKELELLGPVAEVPGVQLVVVGDGPQRSRLQQRLPTAHFLGARHGAELAELHATFDLFVNPCTTETFCQAAQEALASGTPVVGPAAGGMRDRIRPRETGLLTDPGDASSLYRAISELTEDNALLRRLSNNARSGSDLRDWDALGEELVGHYHSVLQSASVHQVERAGTWTSR